jgi:hypothetical protein
MLINFFSKLEPNEHGTWKFSEANKFFFKKFLKLLSDPKRINFHVKIMSSKSFLLCRTLYQLSLFWTQAQSATYECNFSISWNVQGELFDKFSTSKKKINVNRRVRD